MRKKDSFIEKRDACVKLVKQFMDEVYPVDIFGDSFDRKQVEVVAACFHLKDDLK